jgi:hypothetical protein
MAVPGKAAANQKPKSVAKKKEPRAAIRETKRQEVPETPPMSTAAKSPVPEAPPALQASRPPLKKYIRKAGTPGEQRMAVEVVNPRPKEISISALREKFGLPASKTTEIIRDAEKPGKVRRAQNGSYGWSPD